MSQNLSNSTEENNKVFDRFFWLFVIFFSILIGLICFFPYWLTIKPSKIDFSKTGQIGDTIGGTMSPFIAIAAALLTFIAFWVQYKANQQQTTQFRNQADDVKTERFENKFYELLRIQRENTTEIEIVQAIKGRKAFISMFFEFRYCYAQTKKFIEEYYNQEELGFKASDEAIIIDIAYHIFFMGIGNNSDKLVIASLSRQCDTTFVIELIKYLDKTTKQVWKSDPSKKFEVKLKDNPNTLIYTSKYLPYSGHISKLGHYFRHLFQTTKFISEQDSRLFSEEKKCDYAKTLRAQLSDYEQLLLFYNSCSTLGRAWVSECFITKFKMIKNMPLPLADFGVTPQEKFNKEIEYWKEKGKAFFEWDER